MKVFARLKRLPIMVRPTPPRKDCDLESLNPARIEGIGNVAMLRDASDEVRKGCRTMSSI